MKRIILLSSIIIFATSCKREHKCYRCIVDTWAPVDSHKDTVTTCDEDQKNWYVKPHDTLWTLDHSSFVYIEADCY
jgi:hypothetical protein